MKHFISIKYILLILLLVFLICAFYRWFIYIYVTHMSDEEVEWVTNRKEGEKMHFSSQDGKVATAKITGITVANSSNPFNWDSMKTGRKPYVANAEVKYEFEPCKNEESLRLWKGNNKNPITFSSNLGGGWVWRILLKTTTLKVNGKSLKDVMYFDNEDTKGFFHDENIKVRNYYWSKKYGLVQYTLKDGTVFSRIDLDKQPS